MFLLQVASGLPPSIPIHATFTETPMPWYAAPDWWVAIGTVILAIVTYRLVWLSQKAQQDSRDAIKIAERNAAAAQKSADTAIKSMELTLRAYVVVREIRITCSMPCNPSIPQGIRLFITNVGQTPALNSVFTCTAGVQTLPFESHGSMYEHDATILQLKGTIGHSQTEEVQIMMTNGFMSEHEAGLTFGGKQLLLRGNIKYLDFISNRERQTDFNYIWHTINGEFRAVEAIGNTMT